MKPPPFSGMYTANLPALNNRWRLKEISKFIGVLPEKTLDIGSSNWLGRELGIKEFTSGDLNWEMRTKSEQYDAICCFEVINHLFNHGILLQNISKNLVQGGKLYLSTPKQGLLAYYHGRANYVELKPRNVKIILEYFGFHIKRMETKRAYPWQYIFYGFLQPLRWIRPFKGDTIHHSGAPKAKWYFFGLRPPLKWLLHKYVIIEAEKI